MTWVRVVMNRLWLTWEDHMCRRDLLLATTTAVFMGGALLLGTIGAQAGWKEDQVACEADGGTFTFENGVVSCQTSTCVGGSDAGGCGQTVDEEESSHGHLDNRPQHEEDCSGPGNGGSDAQCP
jgi:outer membrane protease